jgi:glutamate synthase (NADPH/NADH) small chain
MADKKGFLKFDRKLPQKQKVEERLKHFREFNEEVDDNFINIQSARCMDCGIPFCHSGCPLGNIIPDFNVAVYKEEWQQAYEILKSTNNFPEFTGRICPAPCESSCVLGINNNPVAIEFIEKSIIEKAYEENWVKVESPGLRTGKKVAVVGSGPAGLAAADQLNKAGHSVTVYERQERLGGLLRYGIPDFKLEKWVIDRKLEIMEAEGIQFKTNCNVGEDIAAKELAENYDSVVLCGGSTIPRDLPIDGREMNGIYFAMDYLKQNNQKVGGDLIPAKELIKVKGKKVLVIGGGDTGSDCVGTSNRLGASAVHQIELLAKPPNSRGDHDPWPLWPMVLRTSTSHEEGCDREWALLTKRFISKDGINLSGVEVVNVQWSSNKEGKFQMTEIPGSKQVIACDFVFLAIGFVHPQWEGLLNDLNVSADNRSNVDTSNYQTSIDKIFAAGDMRRGQSLVVWAIAEGREAAKAVDEFLMKEQAVLESNLESVLKI